MKFTGSSGAQRAFGIEFRDCFLGKFDYREFDRNQEKILFATKKKLNN
ncbi:hypothetical protein [Geminocystis herdmanii]|nr:hypothetical protein [Geminocystis herdmanii]